MLKADGGNVEIKGSKIDLLAELSVLIRNLVRCGAFDEKDINKCVELALLSEKDLNERFQNVKEEASITLKELDEFRKFLEDLLND